MRLQRFAGLVMIYATALGMAMKDSPARARARGRRAWGYAMPRLLTAWGFRAEIAVYVAWFGGWGFITRAVAKLWRADVVWSLSVGLLLLGLVGFKFLGVHLWHGQYHLAKAKPPANGQ